MQNMFILTLSPFTMARTMPEFMASNYSVKKSRAVKQETEYLDNVMETRGKLCLQNWRLN